MLLSHSRGCVGLTEFSDPDTGFPVGVRLDDAAGIRRTHPRPVQSGGVTRGGVCATLPALTDEALRAQVTDQHLLAGVPV